MITLLQPRSLDAIRKSDKHKIIVLHKEIPVVQSFIDKLDSKLMAYSTSTKYEIDKKVEEFVNHCLLSSQKWVDQVHTCYKKYQLNVDAIDKKSRKPIEKFSRSSNVNIFEWFTLFEKHIDNKGSDTDRAEILFSDFLSADLQSEIREHRRDYQKMKGWLLSNMGDTKFMLAQILKEVDKEKIPELSASLIDVTNYLRKLNNSFKLLNELATTPTIPPDELQE